MVLLNRKAVERPAGRSMLIRYPTMATEPEQTSPLDYRSPGGRRPRRRWMIVTLLGVAIALVGAIVFYFAHEIARPVPGVFSDGDNRRLRELLWGAFGIALLLVG